MYGAAIAEGSGMKLKCVIVELACPPCRKGASMDEDDPSLKFCHI
jgi:hypothetical protein